MLDCVWLRGEEYGVPLPCGECSHCKANARIAELEALCREARDWIDHGHSGQGLPRDACCQLEERIDAVLNEKGPQ